MVKNPESLQNEIAILRKLDHPMIVRLYETFEDEKNFYLVQEYVKIYTVSVREANSSIDSNNMGISAKTMPVSYSLKSLNASGICTVKRYAIETSSLKTSS